MICAFKDKVGYARLGLEFVRNDMERELSEIIEDLKKGRKAAFNTIVLRYQDKLFRILIHLVGDRHEAEDMIQETFVRVIRGIRNYDHREKFDQWIFSIANHLACDHLRRKKNRPRVYTEDMQSFSIAEQNGKCSGLEDKELSDMIYKAIGSLPIEQRQVFLLREEAELTFQEIAELLGIPLNTALGRMHYAIEKLRSQLKKVYQGENDV